MNLSERVPRLKRSLAAPMSPRIRRSVLISCGAILWGAAWLPGGRYVHVAGWITLIGLTLLIWFRRGVRRDLYQRFSLPVPELPPSERYTRLQTLLVLLAMTARILWWPLQVHLWIERPFLDHFAWSAYAVTPALDPPRTPRLVGLFLIDELRPEPTGVWLHVAGGGPLYWKADPTAEYLAWRRSELTPSSGPWSADPIYSY
jgi:hypothetical protein